MKRLIGFLMSFVLMVSLNAQTTHTIGVSGLSFSPSDLIVSINDKIVFNAGANHPVIEVSQSTWEANENTPLSGGFSFSNGQGEITFTQEGVHYYICESHYSGGMKGKITVSTATNIRTNDIDKRILVYPNPLNQDKLFINYPGLDNKNISIELFDITGKQIFVDYKNMPSNEIGLDFSMLVTGVYIVKLNSQGEIHTRKIIKN